MKKMFKKVKAHFSKKMKDQSGQGMLEYILLVVVIVGLVFILKAPLKDQVESIQSKLKESVGSILQ